MAQPIPLGPWPLGVDNVHAPSHRVFQVPGQGQPPARLRGATDVDLDDEGWPSARLGAVELLTMEDPQGLWCYDGVLYAQDGKSFGTVTFGTTVEFTEVVALADTAPLVFTQFGGQLYATNGVDAFVLIDGVAYPWGMPVPTIVLSADTDGASFSVGTYFVQASFSDELGNEGGASNISGITISENSDIIATISGYTDLIKYVNFYVGKDKQVTTSFSTKISIDTLDPGDSENTLVALISAATTDADPPKTEQMTGPPTGLSGIGYFRGYVLGWRDNCVFRSEALEPQLWHGENVYQFPSTVRAVAGLQFGFWVGTDDGLFWVSGDAPESWIPKASFVGRIFSGSLVIDGTKIPQSQASDRVALFVSQEGLLCGLPDGQVANLTQQRYSFTTGTKAKIVYNVRSGLRQLNIVVS